MSILAVSAGGPSSWNELQFPSMISWILCTAGAISLAFLKLFPSVDVEEERDVGVT